MRIFQYAVIHNPDEKSKENGAKSTVIVQVTSCLASTQENALLIAGRSIPAEYLDRLDQIEVACRPF